MAPAGHTARTAELPIHDDMREAPFRPDDVSFVRQALVPVAGHRDVHRRSSVDSAACREACLRELTLLSDRPASEPTRRRRRSRSSG